MSRSMSRCTCPDDGSRYCEWCQYVAAKAGVSLSPRPTLMVTETTGVAEEDFGRALKAVATNLGYLTYHTHNSKRSSPGFPDWAIVHPQGGPLFLWELKRQDREAKPSPAQERWLEALDKATLVHSHVYRPSDWELMRTILERWVPRL